MSKSYDSISHNKGQYLLEIWAQTYGNLISNFFSDNFVKEEGNETDYISKSELKDGRILRGVYYKEEDVPVYFVKSMRIDKKSKAKRRLWAAEIFNKFLKISGATLSQGRTAWCILRFGKYAYFTFISSMMTVSPLPFSSRHS